MKITGIEFDAVHVNHRGDWVFVHVLTDAGIRGVGEMRSGKNYAAQLSALRDLGEAVTGCDPRKIEAIVSNYTQVARTKAELYALGALEQACGTFWASRSTRLSTRFWAARAETKFACTPISTGRRQTDRPVDLPKMPKPRWRGDSTRSSWLRLTACPLRTAPKTLPWESPACGRCGSDWPNCRSARGLPQPLHCARRARSRR